MSLDGMGFNGEEKAPPPQNLPAARPVAPPLPENLRPQGCGYIGLQRDRTTGDWLWQRVVKTRQHTSTATFKNIEDAAVSHDYYMLTRSGLTVQECRERGLNYDLGFVDPRVGELLTSCHWDIAFKQVKRQLAGAQTRRKSRGWGPSQPGDLEGDEDTSAIVAAGLARIRANGGASGALGGGGAGAGAGGGGAKAEGGGEEAQGAEGEGANPVDPEALQAKVTHKLGTPLESSRPRRSARATQGQHRDRDFSPPATVRQPRERERERERGAPGPLDLQRDREIIHSRVSALMQQSGGAGAGHRGARGAGEGPASARGPARQKRSGEAPLWGEEGPRGAEAATRQYVDEYTGEGEEDEDMEEAANALIAAAAGVAALPPPRPLPLPVRLPRSRNGTAHAAIAVAAPAPLPRESDQEHPSSSAPLPHQFASLEEMEEWTRMTDKERLENARHPKQFPEDEWERLPIASLAPRSRRPDGLDSIGLKPGAGGARQRWSYQRSIGGKNHQASRTWSTKREAAIAHDRWLIEEVGAKTARARGLNYDLGAHKDQVVGRLLFHTHPDGAFSQYQKRGPMAMSALPSREYPKLPVGASDKHLGESVAINQGIARFEPPPGFNDLNPGEPYLNEPESREPTASPDGYVGGPDGSRRRPGRPARPNGDGEEEEEGSPHWDEGPVSSGPGLGPRRVGGAKRKKRSTPRRWRYEAEGEEYSEEEDGGEECQGRGGKSARKEGASMPQALPLPPPPPPFFPPQFMGGMVAIPHVQLAQLGIKLPPGSTYYIVAGPPLPAAASPGGTTATGGEDSAKATPAPGGGEYSTTSALQLRSLLSLAGSPIPAASILAPPFTPMFAVPQPAAAEKEVGETVKRGTEGPRDMEEKLPGAEAAAAPLHGQEAPADPSAGAAYPSPAGQVSTPFSSNPPPLYGEFPGGGAPVAAVPPSNLIKAPLAPLSATTVAAAASIDDALNLTPQPTPSRPGGGPGGLLEGTEQGAASGEAEAPLGRCQAVEVAPGGAHAVPDVMPFLVQ